MEIPYNEWLQITFFGNTLPAWSLAVLVFFVAYIGLQKTKTFAIRNLKRLSAGARNGRYNLAILPVKKHPGCFC